jgi:DNA-directed RNA polymerase subunit beta'
MKNLSQLKSFEALKIYIASDDDVLSWSHGEVLKPETINYRTFKSERDGLFDEKIFGPSKNYECYCGKYKGIRYKGVICDKCGVEITTHRVRRERMGHIKLASPVAHVWFFRGIPSKMALLLNLTPRNVESIVYFAAFIVSEMDGAKKAQVISNIEKDMEKSRAVIIRRMEDEVKEVEKEIKRLEKKKDDFAAQEEILKLRQEVQTVKNSVDKEIEESDKTYKLIQKKIEGVNLHTVVSDNEYVSLSTYLDHFCTMEIGAEALKNILSNMDLNEISQSLRDDLERAKGQKAAKISKRLKVVEQFRRAGLEPSRMILEVVPVIPPDLRPMVQLDGGRFASSDLNDLYRRLINRNNRLKRLLNLGAPQIIVRNEKRMLQEAVDALFDSSKQRQKSRTARGKKQLRSLTDMIKGKQGIFRLNLLGKRVDYSGRAVIIDGPDLKLDECGVPKDMALELFKPMVLREILARGYAPNVKSAKFFLEDRSPEVWDILEIVVKDHPVLLNRAPTLWRLGIQAFYPKLIEGNAIKLHLAVVTGFNADFDGDQMAIHVPLSKKAIQEAKEIMLSTNNLFKPSDGSPIAVPTKTLLFGSYYVTSVDEKLPVFDRIFADKSELLYAHHVTKEIDLRQLTKVRLEGEIVETTIGRVLFNDIIPESQGFINDTVNKKKAMEILTDVLVNDPSEVGVKLIDAMKDIGSEYGTVCGLSVGLSDICIPENKDNIIEGGRKAAADVERNFRRGLTTKKEHKYLITNNWNGIIKDLDDEVWNNLDSENSIKVLLDSGSTRGSRDQLKQLAGMKGLVSDPTGKIVEMPIFGNYKEGLSAIEYFVASRGARKGLVDRGLKTADAGYLTRRLVDVSQDVLIREEDCDTGLGREMKVGESTMLQTFTDRVVGRYLAEDAKVGRKTIVKRGTLLSRSDLEAIGTAKIETISIRSPLTCETRRGLCARCYGTDLMTGELVRLGSAVGVAAAQSIGEPGTQLTMQTFHTGGIAGKDITSGLPRVEELAEARSPKALSIMSEIGGKVSIVKNGDERKILIKPTDSSEEILEHDVDPVSEIIVADDQVVSKGEKLTSGHLDLTELYRSVGGKLTKKYIIDEIQGVYASQGVALNDKHIEVIVKQMFNHVRVDDAGETDFMDGEIVTKASFEEENEKVIASGGEPATGKLTLLGITKASLMTDSFLSAASFIQTSSVLTDAAAAGKVDNLLGLKENVIIGRLIPTGDDAKFEE